MAQAVHSVYGIYIEETTTISETVKSIKEFCFGNLLKDDNQKWNYILSSLITTSNMIEILNNSTECDITFKVNIGKAKAHLGLSMVLLLSPTSPLDPVVMEGTFVKYTNLLVSIITCK